MQGTTLGRVIDWAGLTEPESEKSRLTTSQAEAAMAQAQFATVQSLAYDREANVIHPQLLERYQRRATTIVDYAERTAHYTPMLLPTSMLSLGRSPPGSGNFCDFTAQATLTTRR